jgi:hypothetical protein
VREKAPARAFARLGIAVAPHAVLARISPAARTAGCLRSEPSRSGAGRAGGGFAMEAYVMMMVGLLIFIGSIASIVTLLGKTEES